MDIEIQYSVNNEWAVSNAMHLASCILSQIQRNIRRVQLVPSNIPYKLILSIDNTVYFKASGERDIPPVSEILEKLKSRFQNGDETPGFNDSLVEVDGIMYRYAMVGDEMHMIPMSSSANNKTISKMKSFT